MCRLRREHQRGEEGEAAGEEGVGELVRAPRWVSAWCPCCCAGVVDVLSGHLAAWEQLIHEHFPSNVLVSAFLE